MLQHHLSYPRLRGGLILTDIAGRRAVMRIGIVGTGPVGRTLGAIWARAGHEVAFGSRDPARAAEAAAGLASGQATTQEAAAAFGEVVLWTARGVMPTDPDALAGKIVLDPNNRGPGPDGGYARLRPEGPSLAERLQAAVPRARVVKAFNTVVMRMLTEAPERVQASGAQVFLAGDDAEAKRVAVTLASEMGLGAVDLGGLEAAWLAEALADTFRQGMATSPAGWRQALVFADLSA
jgi:8-hydroxy-5-deazaflavin:NADPH oxidoreductase